MEIKVFVSYSRKDKAYLEDNNLLGHLKALQREGISFWWDDAIVTGDDWNEEIKAKIKESHIALLLISQSYLDSKYIANEEVADFLKQCQGESFIIFPVILSDCKWDEHEWLKRLQLAPGGTSLEEHSSDPERLESLYQEIRQDLAKQVQKIKEAIRMPSNMVAFRDWVDNEKAVILIHDSEVSWGDFPRFLVTDKKMDNWNIFSFGYSSRIRWRDLIWEKNRSLRLTAHMLRTACSVHPLGRYKEVALIAHSIAGLIVQLSILDSDDFAKRVSSVILFGTPSAGLPKSRSRFLLRNLNLSPDGEFIKDLRKRWSDKFSQKLPFNLLTIAGDEDQTVLESSSLDPFPLSQRGSVPGDHIQMIQPSGKNAHSVQIVIGKLGSNGHQSQT